MAENPDESAICDHCGASMPNSGVLYAVRVVGMRPDGQQRVLVLCTTGNRCAQTLTGADWYDSTAQEES